MDVNHAESATALTRLSRRAVLRALAGGALLSACGGDAAPPATVSPTTGPASVPAVAATSPPAITATPPQTAPPLPTPTFVTQPTPSPTVVPTPRVDVPVVTQYRGDAARTGVYPVRSVRTAPRVLWQQQLGNPAYGAPTLAGNTLYVGAQPGRLLALDAMTGAERWRVEDIDQTISSSAVLEDLVLVGTGTGLRAFERATGVERWSIPTPVPAWSAAPLVYGDTVCFGSDDGVFYLYDLATQRERWRFASGRSLYYYAAAHADTLYVATGAVLSAFDFATGTERWQARNDTYWGPLAVGAEHIYAGSESREFFAVDRATGDIAWTFAADDTLWSAPALGDGLVFAGNQDGVLYALDRESGELAWSFEAADAVTNDLVLAHGVLYFGVGRHGPTDPAQERPFYAVNASSGELLWSVPGDGIVLNAAAVGDGLVVFVTQMGELYVLSEA